MTKTEALSKLIKTKDLTTDLLKPLNIRFSSFLDFCQLDTERRKDIVEDLIEDLIDRLNNE